MTTTMPKRTGTGLVSDPLAPEWRSLYDEHAPRIRRIATHRVGPNLAEEVVQDTFLRAYRNRHSFDASLSIRAWLNVIALRASIDALRHRTASIEVLLGETEDQAAADNGEEEFFNDVRRKGINDVLSGLNDRYRRVLELVVIEGWTHEEVARAEGISAKAVKSLLCRARSAFKDGYTAFSEKSGVFGGAAVGTAILRLRMRIHRFVEHHAGAVTTAMATVAVIGVAAVPTTQMLLPSSAVEPVSSVSAPAADATRADVGSTGEAPGEASVSTSPSGATVAASGGANSSSVTPAPAGGGVQVETTTAIGREGNGAGVGVSGERDSPMGDGSTFAGIYVEDCSTGLTAPIFCAVVDTTGDPATAPTE